MSAVERRFTLRVDNEIEQDIFDVGSDDPAKAATLVALIEELSTDQGLCELLVDTTYSDHQIESVKEFVSLQQQGFNAYTVRHVDIAGWRIITGVDHKQRIVAILYIMRRDEDYDEDARARVTAAYERLGMHRFSR